MRIKLLWINVVFLFFVFNFSVLFQKIDAGDDADLSRAIAVSLQEDSERKRVKEQEIFWLNQALAESKEIAEIDQALIESLKLSKKAVVQDNGQDDGDENFELAIKDTWERFTDELMKHIESQGVVGYAQPEDFLVKILKNTFKKSSFKIMKNPAVNAFLERTLLLLSVYQEPSIADQFTFLVNVDDITQDRDSFESIAPYLYEIRAAMIQFSHSINYKSFSTFKNFLKSIKDRIIDNKNFEEKPTIENLFYLICGTLESDLELFEDESELDDTPRIKIVAQNYIHYFNLCLDRFNPQSASDKILKRLRKARTFLSYHHGADIVWCGCQAAPLHKRIALIFKMVQDTLARFPNREQLLVYTSMASGNLLMDLLFIKELQYHGYKNIDINLIDTANKDEKAIEGMIESAHSAAEKVHAQGLLANAVAYNEEQINEENLSNVLEVAVAKSLFKKEIGAQFTWLKDTVNRKVFLGKKNVFGTQITVWYNAHDYIAFAQKNPLYKTDILMIIDVAGYSGKASEPQMADGIIIGLKSHQKEPLSVYSAEKEELEGEVKENAEKLIDISMDEQTLDAIFESKKLIYIAFTLRQGLEAYTNLDPLLESEGLALHLFDEKIKELGVYKNVVPHLGQELADFFSERNFDIIWVSDAYIGYSNIALMAAKNDAWLYMLDSQDRGIDLSRTSISLREDYFKKGVFIDPTILKKLRALGYARY